MNGGAGPRPRIGEWTQFVRATDVELEAMHARFCQHVYHRHSHDTYSFGVTEHGAQAFRCRGASHVSAAGMVMTFNPDDPHDGSAATVGGFRYRMIHIGPGLLGESAGGAPAPLFAEPVVADARLASALRRLSQALLGETASTLCRDDLLAETVHALLQRASTRPAEPVRLSRAAETSARLALRVREQIADDPLAELSAGQLAAAAGVSRFAVYRAFHRRYGLAPSDYQRQLRLHAARRLLAAGHRPAVAAVAAGFADQAHLTRWFTRCLGLTPAAYRAACGCG